MLGGHQVRLCWVVDFGLPVGLCSGLLDFCDSQMQEDNLFGICSFWRLQQVSAAWHELLTSVVGFRYWRFRLGPRLGDRLLAVAAEPCLKVRRSQI